MGRLCGGAHEISGIKATIFLHGWVGVGDLWWWGGWGWVGVGVIGWVMVVGRDGVVRWVVVGWGWVGVGVVMGWGW